MTNQDIFVAINNLVSNAKFALYDADISTLIWNDERQQPSIEQIQAEIDAVVLNKPLQALRDERNRRIVETDWWVLSDRTPTSEQLAYRQALRDITNTYSSLDDVVWPTKP